MIKPITKKDLVIGTRLMLVSPSDGSIEIAMMPIVGKWGDIYTLDAQKYGRVDQSEYILLNRNDKLVFINYDELTGKEQMLCQLTGRIDHLL